jgi:pyridoxamine 5'-phosphate oxidase-like protein
VGKQFSQIEDQHRTFIESQRIFFVASAAPKGRVNVSPKGMATLRVLGANEVAYLDCTGSGSETRAHLLASPDKRLTVMFCAFVGQPSILRLYGRGQSLMRGTPEYGAMVHHFQEMPGARQIVRLEVELVQVSCGMGVPLFEYKGDRPSLVRYWINQGADNLRRYWGLKNMASIDGLPTDFAPDIMASALNSLTDAEPQS